MTWQVFSRPEAANDVIEIAAWYDHRSEGLGDRFVVGSVGFARKVAIVGNRGFLLRRSNMFIAPDS